MPTITIPDNFDLFIPIPLKNDRHRFFALVLVELDLCASCQIPMLPNNGPFPPYYMIDANAQRKRAGWECPSNQTINDERICETCAQQDKATFLCFLCNQTRKSSQQQRSFGGGDYLCIPCYETSTAKQWETAVNTLNERHRYDHC